MSKHLKVLREAGLVDVEPQAQQRVYELRAKPLRDLGAWLDRYRRIWDARHDALADLVEELEATAKKKEPSHVRRRPHR